MSTWQHFRKFKTLKINLIFPNLFFILGPCRDIEINNTTEPNLDVDLNDQKSFLSEFL